MTFRQHNNAQSFFTMPHVSSCLVFIVQAAYINHGCYIGQCLHLESHMYMRFLNYIIYDDIVGSIASYSVFKYCLTSNVKKPKIFFQISTLLMHLSSSFTVDWLSCALGADEHCCCSSSVLFILRRQILYV
jgi:hypothetical protein